MKQSSTHALRHAAIAVAVMWTMASAWSAAAQVEDPADMDGDGVVDTVDQCLDTPPEDLIAADGCSVCPCDETPAGDLWTSHDAYVGCVTIEAHAAPTRTHGATVSVPKDSPHQMFADPLRTLPQYSGTSTSPFVVFGMRIIVHRPTGNPTVK